MATTDWSIAEDLQSRGPHTFNALQHLVKAMSKIAKHQGKKSFFGKDKGLEAYKDFEHKLRDTILALVLDGIIERNSQPDYVRKTICNVIVAFSQAFPNWQDAYAFGAQYFSIDIAIAESRIQALMQSGE